MEFLYFMERIRSAFGDNMMLLITQLGEETAFLIVALIVFWCIDKRKGYYILSVGFIGTILNQFLKLWFRIPRPWILDERFTIVEKAREAASGYSFPSGHTQSAVGTFGSVAYLSENRYIRWTCISMAILVPFSRMYLGVHTPLDVFVSAAIAVFLIIGLRPVVLGENKNALNVLISIMFFVCCAFMLFVHTYPFPADIDTHNLASGYKNAYTLFGSLVGLIVVYFTDEKWLKFSTKAPIFAQILKVILGFLLILVIKSGLKTPLNFLFGEYIGRAVRYCVIVCFAGIVWPLSFRYFQKIGKG